MIKKIAHYFQVPSEYKSEFFGSLNEMNLSRLALATSLIFVGEVVSFLFRLLFGFSFSDTDTFLIAVAYKLVYSLIIITSYFILKRKNLKRDRITKNLNFFFMLLFLALQLYIARYEFAVSGSLYDFFYGLLLIGIAVVPTNVECLIYISLYALSMLTVALGFPNINVYNLIFIINVSILTAVASRIYYVYSLKNFVSTKKLLKSYDELERLSVTDQLTNIYNRRGLNSSLEYMTAQAVRKREPIAVMIFDLDKFKNYNDRYGHLAGDQCLIKVAECMRECFNRKTDCIGRYGGEEFLAVIAFSSVEEAVTQARKFVDAVENLSIPHQASHVSDVVTISCGIHHCYPQKDENTEKLIQLADIALYSSKKRGGNQHTVYGKDTDSSSLCEF